MMMMMMMMGFISHPIHSMGDTWNCYVLQELHWTWGLEWRGRCTATVAAFPKVTPLLTHTSIWLTDSYHPYDCRRVTSKSCAERRRLVAQTAACDAASVVTQQAVREVFCFALRTRPLLARTWIFLVREAIPPLYACSPVAVLQLNIENSGVCVRKVRAVSCRQSLRSHRPSWKTINADSNCMFPQRKSSAILFSNSPLWKSIRNYIWFAILYAIYMRVDASLTYLSAIRVNPRLRRV